MKIIVFFIAMVRMFFFLLRKWQQIEPKVLLPWYANIISHPSSLTDYFEVGQSWISPEISVKYMISLFYNPFRVQRSFGNHTWDIISIDSSEVNSWLLWNSRILSLSKDITGRDMFDTAIMKMERRLFSDEVSRFWSTCKFSQNWILKYHRRWR